MAGAFKVGIKFQVDQAALNKLMSKVKEVERKAARKGIKAGINQLSILILKEAKDRVPKRTGQLKKSLGRKVRTKKDGSVVYAVIKPRAGLWVKSREGVIGRAGRGKRKGQTFTKAFRIERAGPAMGAIDPVRYAHLVEYGRREVVTVKKKVLAGGGIIYGKRVKSVAPRPFLRPAWERYKSQSTGIIAAYVKRAIADYWKKNRK